MACGTGSDVRDILDLEDHSSNPSKREVLFGDANKPKKRSSYKPLVKKPDGLSREVWGLLYSDSRDPPPVVPTDAQAQGYKQAKIKLGVQRVRPWRWTPFTNPARKDGVVLHHWRRVADEGKEFPFARFDKEVDVPVYSDSEYAQHLHDENWSKQETDHVFDLAKRFDLRFVVMHDRYDTDRFSKRSIEDLKERYYSIANTLLQIRSPSSTSSSDPKPFLYDADHERKRKEQLRRLWDRTPSAIDEEASLVAEMRKIEQRKKDRDKRAADLHKLLSKAEGVSGAGRGGGAIKDKASVAGEGGLTGIRGPDSKKLGLGLKKKNLSSSSLLSKVRASDAAAANPDTAGIRFSDFKTSGVTLRSQRVKLPTSVGQKKTKAIESMLLEVGLDVHPIPTAEVAEHFNDLRSDMVLLYELKTALANCEYELQTLRHRHEASSSEPKEAPATAEEPEVAPKTEAGQEAPMAMMGPDDASAPPPTTTASVKATNKQQKKFAEVIEVQRKRKAALEQKNVLNKLKNRCL